ncbi:MAG: hypothetical protein JSV44_09630 [Candidatus Zixiibacteriota bacterium]|nr:MAG: hypothetical protein JSV44_09630 [candidate division Zixibacteria bacterium]
MKRRNYNLLIFLLLILIYLAGQFLIGTYHPEERRFVFDAPADVDFLYYGAIVNTVFDAFPPWNPAFAGVKLTQPFVQYYPAAILAPLVNPYNAIRALNMMYLVLFGFLLRRLFPKRYGLPLLVLFAGSIFAADINAAGVDFIARGFTHTPFFLLLALAIFSRRLYLRLPSLVIAAFINGYLMLMVLPFLLTVYVFEKRKESLLLLFAGLTGLLAASWFISSEMTSHSIFSLFSKSLYFDPVEIFKHAAPFLILSIFFRQKQMLVLLIVALLFGTFIHYNPFFPVFMAYFAGAMLLAAGEARTPQSGLLAAGFAAILFAGFISASYQKYNPERKNYFPRYHTTTDASVEWILRHTDDSDIFVSLTADEVDLGLIMQHRPVYLGYIGHLGHLGLDWKPRYEATIRLFSSGLAPPDCDYIFYGPVERKYFPVANLPFDTAYHDDIVTIFVIAAAD